MACILCIQIPNRTPEIYKFKNRVQAEKWFRIYRDICDSDYSPIPVYVETGRKRKTEN